MRRKRVLLKVDVDTLRELRELAPDHDLSEVVNEALRRRIRSARWDEFLDEIAAERGGPVPPEIQAKADALWRDLMGYPKAAS
jgi:hypothetical protein